MRIYLFELKKLIYSIYFCIGLGIIVLLLCVQYISEKSAVKNYNEWMYKNFCYTYSDKVDDDLIFRITADYQARQDVLSDPAANSELKFRYQAEADAFNRVFQRVDYSSEIFYDSGWTSLLDGGFYPIVLLGAFLIMLSPLFSYEHEHDVWQITCSTKKRVFINKAKIGAVFSMVSVLFVIYYIFEFIIISRVYDLPNAKIAVNNIFPDLLFETSLIQYAILQKIMMFAGIAAILLSFICIALYINNTILTIVFGAIVLSISYLTRMGLLYPNYLFVKDNSINILLFLAGTAVLVSIISYWIAIAIKKNI